MTTSSDEAAWAEAIAERRMWDTTLLDGIDQDEVW